jgi:hypothetical protein
MRDVEDEAQFPALLMENAKEGYGVRSAGDADGEAQAGGEVGGVEREDGMLRGGHETMIRRGSQRLRILRGWKFGWRMQKMRV